ncbi:MAG: AAA family ATPase [Pseudomonadota bacterium]
MKPIAHLLHGFIGSGKTSFARKLERESGAVRISHDEWMVRLHGWNPPEEQFEEFSAQVEELIWVEAERAIDSGVDVIFDNGFWARESRDAARTRALSFGAMAKFYDVVCPLEIMRLRALDRSKSPRADSLWIDGAGFDKLFVEFEPMQEDEDFVRIDGLDTGKYFESVQ